MSLSMSEYVFSEESGIGNVSIEGSAGFNVRVVAGMYENSIIATVMEKFTACFYHGQVQKCVGSGSGFDFQNEKHTT